MKEYTKSKKVCGVGVNDLNRPVYWIENSKHMTCPIYKIWKSMLVRCYSEKFHYKETYKDCLVVPEWLNLSIFEMWVNTQEWKGKDLDKDLLFPNNKVYSPETCVFVSHDLNTFLLDSASIRGDLPIGVCWHKATGKYAAQCSDPFSRKRGGYLGLFDSPEDAHLAWKKRKHELACLYAEQETDTRVIEALKTRYL